MAGIIPFVLVLCLLAAVRGGAQVVINEIMYAPENPEPEWVELFNAGPGAVNLERWSLHDAAGGRCVLPRRTIASGGYMVITRDSAGLRDARGGRGAFLEASLPVLNNSGDALFLVDSTGLTRDSVYYDIEWGGADGRSLERRLYIFPPMDDSTWAACPGSSGATPGRRNAATPAGFDVAIVWAQFDAERALALALVRNVGTLGSADARLELSVDLNNDGSAAASELLATAPVAAMEPGDSVVISMAWPRLLRPEPEIGILELVMAGDERTANNTAEFPALAPTVDSGIVLNEIMFDPLSVGPRAGAEYVELRNVTAAAINVAGWRVYDATLRPQVTVPATAPAIAPDGYLLLASDTTIYVRFPWLRDSANVVVLRRSGFSFNADEEELTLRNRAGALVDRVAYRGSWHRPDLGDTKGIALERISAGAASGDARNWSSSAAAAGGTPAARNTLDVPVTVSEALLTAEPATVSPDGDGFEDFTRIAYRLPAMGGVMLATVYDRLGRRVRTIANNEPAAAEGEIVWDGRDDDRRALEPGIYLVRLAAYDDRGARFHVACATVIVARRR